MTTGDRDKVLGKPEKGSEKVLVKVDDDLTLGQAWHAEGYTVVPFLDDQLYRIFYTGFEQLFRQALTAAGLHPTADFLPEQYHHLVSGQYDHHLRVINQTKLFQAAQFPIDMALVEQRVSEVLGISVKSIKPTNMERVFHLRVIRPNAADYNPLHRDVWQDENKHAINIYVPLCGSNERSSLQVVPGSHLWAESDTVRSSEGAVMNNIQFNVPGLISSSRPLTLHRPNPKANEMLVFSPYMIHGLSANHNEDQTRISLEMRFWRV